jgi:hypothetical protein
MTVVLLLNSLDFEMYFLGDASSISSCSNISLSVSDSLVGLSSEDYFYVVYLVKALTKVDEIGLALFHQI